MAGGREGLHTNAGEKEEVWARRDEREQSGQDGDTSPSDLQSIGAV